MSSNRVLEDVLRDILGVIQPVNNDWTVRFQVIRELEGVVRSLESLRGCVFLYFHVCSVFSLFHVVMPVCYCKNIVLFMPNIFRRRYINFLMMMT